MVWQWKPNYVSISCWISREVNFNHLGDPNMNVLQTALEMIVLKQRFLGYSFSDSIILSISSISPSSLQAWAVLDTFVTFLHTNIPIHDFHFKRIIVHNKSTDLYNYLLYSPCQPSNVKKTKFHTVIIDQTIRRLNYNGN